MSTHTIKSEKCGPKGFPFNTTVRVESVSGERKQTRKRPKGFKERSLVWTGTVTGQFTRHFDPGKYVWKAHKHDPAGANGFREHGEFLVDMTEEQWQKVSGMSPKNQKPTLTTDGIVWSCQFPGCDAMTTSKISAVLHEADDHFGADLLRAVDPLKAKAEADAKASEMLPETSKAERIKGK